MIFYRASQSFVRIDLSAGIAFEQLVVKYISEGPRYFKDTEVDVTSIKMIVWIFAPFLIFQLWVCFDQHSAGTSVALVSTGRERETKTAPNPYFELFWKSGFSEKEVVFLLSESTSSCQSSRKYWFKYWGIIKCLYFGMTSFVDVLFYRKP